MGILIDPSSSSSCSDSSSSVKLTSQMVGFLSVLAISGSVALLSLSKDKIWNYVFDAQHLATKSLPFHASDSIPTPPSEQRRNADKPRISKKKVRFAPDVVDPPTNGNEYRLRCIKVVANKKHSAIANRDLNRARASNADAENRTENRSPTLQQQQQQRRCSSHIPANRIALYKGLQRSRMQYSLH